ncbi:nonstructural protein [Blackfly microvirus SF02]|uniref:Nonstructural protein n=1 Tax=Blackfly microvirus SF02 TaxID=2576452 RepID=A0A4P8PK57_9VIRU|nr:nonstructural protein [Blackfly microvirus SF02]
MEAFLQPFFSPTHGAAIRSLTEACNDPKHAFFTGAKYYSLYHLGAFDDADGRIYSNDNGPPVFLMDCVQLINKP